MYQTVVKPPRGDISITYHIKKMTALERKILERYGIEIVTHRKLK